MNIAYFDCFSGISGDMVLGALVDAGVPVDALRTELAKLNLSGYQITAEKVMRSGLAATKVHVILSEEAQPARHFADIEKIINDSGLSPAIKKKSIRIFERMADAEAKVHGTTPDRVHFHEVGAIDAIIDIVGSIIGLDVLGAASITGSPVNLGSGTIKSAHGTLPVPSPAAAELLRGIPVYSSAISFELTTPTGAAIISTLGSAFGTLPEMKISRIAHGAGNRDLPGHPNILRLFVGQSVEKYEEDSSVIIETNIDDMNPQVYDYVIEKLMKQGAHDAYLVPVIMKKGRPGILLSVLTDKTGSRQILETIFRETTSIGVRIHEVGRKKLHREIALVETRYGKIRVKVSTSGEHVLTITPEHDDCRRIAEEKDVPLKTVMEETRNQYMNQFSRADAEDAEKDRK